MDDDYYPCCEHCDPDCQFDNDHGAPCPYGCDED